MELLAAIGIIGLSLVGLHALNQRKTSAATWWFAGWSAAVLSGVLYIDRSGLPVLGAAGLFVGTLSPALILIGVMALVGRKIPNWLLPVYVAMAVVRSTLAFAGFWTPAQALGLTVGPIAAGAAAWLAWRGVDRERASIARQLLAPSLLAVAVLGAASEIQETLSGELPTTFALAWMVLVPPTIVLQLSALTERTRDALAVSGEELGRLVEARTEELDAAVASLRREVDERRAAEEALSESEERYRNVSELSSDFSFQLRIDPELGLQREWVTEAFERITGYPPQALDDGTWAKLLDDADRQDAEERIETASGNDEPQKRIHRIQRPDGESRWITLQYHVRRSEIDGELRVLGAARDVTEAKLAEDAALALAHQMEEAQRVESLGLLTGGIAHDFNNLLAVILGNIRLVHEDLPPDSALVGKLVRARAAAKHAVSLTEQMLSYSGKAAVTLEPVELGQLARALEDLLRASVGSTCRLSLELGEPVSVEGDPTRLRQVLLNLATNASESLEGRAGHVTIRTGCDVLTAEDLSGLGGARDPAPGEYAWFEVSDDGSGMEPETLRRIFEPFYTTKFSGRGLGLASSLGIVRAHGGVIDLESEPGRGTRVRVLIPACRAEVARGEPVRRTELESRRILVVDDDEAVLEIATEFLTREGCIAVPAEGGQCALELFASDATGFDAAVIDLAMPGLDGRALFQKLRVIQPELPVVLATGYNLDRVAEGLAEESHVGFLRKPYAVEDLVSALASVISSKPEDARPHAI